MTALPVLLAQVREVYDDLVDASLPVRTGEPSDRSPDPREKPAPGNLAVMQHRHQLVRGLRWWVSAVRDPDDTSRVGESVTSMCVWLLDHLDVMAPEDRAELRNNLRSWLVKASGYLGDQPAPAPLPLPAEAYDQRVRVADAAKLLGCTVRTIQRRVPVERRTGGLVLLREAWRCDHCDLAHGECEHTRAVSR